MTANPSTYGPTGSKLAQVLRRCVDSTTTRSEIHEFDKTAGSAGQGANVDDSAPVYICGATYDDVVKSAGVGTATVETSNAGSYACRVQADNKIEKYDATHALTWHCDSDTDSAYTCVSEDASTGYINPYFGTQTAAVSKNYAALSTANALTVTETLIETCLADATYTWCDVAADGTSAVTLVAGGAAFATGAAVAADNSQTWTFDADANHTFKWELDGGFTETFQGTTTVGGSPGTIG